MSNAQDLDGDVLGEEIGDDRLPGVGDYPADQAVGVNDPNLVAPDDVAMREARTRGEDAGPPADDARSDLIPPDGDDGLADAEQQMVATMDDGGDVEPPAEVAALHIDQA